MMGKGIKSFRLLPQVVELNKFLHAPTQYLQANQPADDTNQSDKNRNIKKKFYWKAPADNTHKKTF